MRRFSQLVAVTLVAIPVLGAEASPPTALYSLDDLGPLGGPSRTLDFTEPGVHMRGEHLKCRIGSVNGINSSGEVVATRIDANGQTYATVNELVLHTVLTPYIGCSISDDHYVVGQKSHGAAIWYGTIGVYYPFPTLVAPLPAVDSLLLAVPTTASIELPTFHGTSVAGVFRNAQNEIKSYVGSHFKDTSALFPELGGGGVAVANGVANLPGQPLGFHLVGAYLPEPGVGAPAAFWSKASRDGDLYWLPSEADVFETAAHDAVLHAVNSSGMAVGCKRGNGMEAFIYRSGRPQRYDSPPSSCLYDVNESGVAVGEVGLPGLQGRTGLLMLPGGKAHRFSDTVSGIPLVDPGAEGWSIESVRGINDKGELAANAVRADGTRHAVRLRPNRVEGIGAVALARPPLMAPLAAADWVEHPRETEAESSDCGGPDCAAAAPQGTSCAAAEGSGGGTWAVVVLAALLLRRRP